VLLLLGLPCAAGLVAGGVRLLQRRTPALLFGSALGAVGVLVLSLVVGVATMRDDEVAALAVFLVLAAPLPVITAVFARLSVVRGWVAAAATPGS
jgi:hypothetical protein